MIRTTIDAIRPRATASPAHAMAILRAARPSFMTPKTPPLRPLDTATPRFHGLSLSVSRPIILVMKSRAQGALTSSVAPLTTSYSENADFTPEGSQTTLRHLFTHFITQ